MTSQPLGEAFIPIRATLDKLDGDLASARGKVSKALDGISANVKKAGKVVAAGLAAGVVAVGVGVAAIASQAIPAASNLNEALNASTVVFGDAAAEIQAFGKTAADSAGLSEAAFNQLAAQTGAMLQNYGLEANAAADATIDLASRAADMASIFNTDVDDAMTAVNAALRGEADPIERYGVSMNAAAVEAKALALGLADTTGELDQAALTQARLALLMEQTDAIAGDFVNTNDQLANASRVQSARWENFIAMLGGFALPILETFQGLFMDLAESVFPLVIAAVAPVAEVVTVIGESFAGFIEALASGADPLESFKLLIFEIGQALGMNAVEAALLTIKFQELVAGFQGIIDKVTEALAPIWESISGFVSMNDVLIALGLTVLSVIIPIIVSFVASLAPIILTIGAIIAIVALLRNAWENDWGGIRTALTEWWEGTGKPIFDQLKAWLQVNIPAAINVLKAFWENTLLPAIERVWSWLSTVLIPFVRDTLIPFIQEKLTAAIQTLSDFWTNTLQPALDAVWSFIDGDLMPLFESLWDLFNVAGTLALQALAGIWENTLEPALRTVWEFVQNNIIPIFESLVRVVKEDMEPPLKYLSETVLSGLKDAFDNIKSAIQFVTSAVQSLISKLKKLELPSAFTPGSPTPFELGLLGINKALKGFNTLLDQNGLIGSPSMSLNPALNPMMGGLTSESGSTTNYSPVTNVHTNQDPLRVLRASRHLDRLSEIP